MQPARIELDRVNLTLGGTPVLRDVSLSLCAHRIGVLGRNGSGKTTLARVIAGLVAADQGHVRVAGVDVAKDRKAALGTVGILFQNPDQQIIFPTVGEEIGFGLRQQGLTASQVSDGVAQVLETFGRSAWYSASVHSLSQGQRQLVCLMSILAMRPQVIVLDEPFSGLDIPTRMRLQRVLDALPVTLVHITHDPDAVAEAEQVVWIDQGKLLRSGAPSEVLPDFSAKMIAIGEGDDRTDITG